MPAAIISTKGQVTIPLLVRESLGVTVGDAVDFIEQPDGSWTLNPKTASIRDVIGILPRKNVPVPSIEQMDADVARAVAERNR